jgi:DNA repair protein RecN (Recombination protein N)
MIQRLYIKNYAIIEELEINFSDKLTIITGETGAGKSILLGALGLIMGKRADTKVFYNADSKCVIEATFHVAKYKIKPFFTYHELDYSDEVIVRREVTPTGTTRAFINDTPVNLKVLQQLSDSLIDLHQQFDTLDIHNVSFQLRMMDALAGNETLLRVYQELYRNYTADKKKLADLYEQNEMAARELDYVSFQLNEFNEAELIENEQTELETELDRLTNAEDIKQILSAAFMGLSEGDNSIVSQMEDLSIKLEDIKQHHPKLEAGYERFESILLELKDLAEEFESIAEDTEYDEARILEAQARLDLIYKLQQKHRVKTMEDLLAIQEKLEKQYSGYSDLSSGIKNLEKKIADAEKDLVAQAAKLSERRKSVIKGFEKKVHALLKQLSMEHAQLEVSVTPLDKPAPTGMDDINFLFSPNKGSKFLPIKDVASGGELSRLTLCTKSLVADAIPLPTLIFDEIDTGISGDVAMKMGNILQELSNRHQVVSITHTPQIAVKANQHYFVFKKDTADRTITKVKLLNDEERIRAVATMLSGNPPTESAIANAKELLFG